MIRMQAHGCPRTEALSALIDGELAGRERDEITTHAAACPVCGAVLADFGELRTRMQPLVRAAAGVDVAALIESRLPARGRAEAARPRRGWRWQLAPAGLAAAGVLATGAYLGALLAGGTTAVAAQPAAMAVFDAIPPGGLCAGLPSCTRRGR